MIGLALAALLSLMQIGLARGQSAAPGEDREHWLRERLAYTPLDQAALRDLALLERKRGHGGDARTYAVLAGQLGWRDSRTQLMLIDDAVRRRDVVETVRRMDSLMRREPQMDALLLPVLHAAAMEERGRQIIETRLAADPPWRSGFFGALEYLPDADQPAHERLLAHLARQGTLRDDTDLVPYVRDLARRGENRHARTLWVALTAAGKGLLLDPDFERLSLKAPARRVSPFEWLAKRVPGADMRVGGELDRISSMALFFTVDRSAFGALLTQRTVLDPGRYRLITATPSAGALRRGVLRWEVSCLPGRRTLQTAGKAVAAGWQEVFIVPDSGCTAQQVTLEVRRSDGARQNEASFKSVTIAASAGNGHGGEEPWR